MYTIDVLYGITSVFFLLLLLRIYIKEGIEVRFLLSFSYAWYYFLVPFILLITKVGKSTELVYTNVIFNSNVEDWFIAYIRCIVGGIIIVLGLYSNIFQGRKVLLDIYQINKKDETEEIRMLGMVLLILGGGALLFLFNQLGGVGRAISLGSEIRSYRSDNAKWLSAMGAMAKTLSGVVIGSGYCFLTSYYIGRRKRDFFFFLLSFLISILYLFFNSGRSNLVFYLLVYVFGFCRSRKIDIAKPGFIAAVIVLIFASPIGYVIDNINAPDFSIANMINYIQSDNSIDGILEFTYPISNVLSIKDINRLYGYRWFVDYITCFEEILPARLLNKIGINISGIIPETTNISKFYISKGSLGGTPVDLITLGCRQVPILGLVFNLCVYMFVAKRIQILAYNLGVSYSYLVWYVYIFMFDMLISNDLGTMIKANIGEIMILFVLLRIEKRRRYASINYRRCQFNLG